MKVLSLFSGAGGLDLGLEEAGFEIAGCVEVDPDARATLALNRPEWTLVDHPRERPGDIMGAEPKGFLRRLRIRRGDVTLLAGGPPCQPFSKSGLWVSGHAPRMTHPQAKTLRAYMDLLAAVLPEVMLLESVDGIAFKTNGARRNGDREADGALDVVRAALVRINRKHGTSYDPQILHLDAAAYGVPQRRRRVFVLAVRDGSAIVEPRSTHSENGHEDKRRFTTAWDAIGHLESPDIEPDLLPRGRWAELLPSIPEGHNYLWHTARGGGEPLFGWRTRYWSFLLKLAKDRPSWTLQATPGPATGPFHWLNRRLSPEEMARLQTFPDDYSVAGGYRSAVRQLGNAVPSAVGELLGLEIRRQLFGHRTRRSLRLLPKQSDDCPRLEKAVPVPEQYLQLRGVHAEHPGTGRGPRALQRSTARSAQT
jgi:DNA (cytosine-5)-methyltransferase 1